MTKLTPPVEGLDEVSNVRDALMEFRDDALKQGAMLHAVLLSHAIAWLGVLVDMEEEDDN